MESASAGAPPRSRRWIRTPPAPLAALLVLIALLGITWALIVPAWQSPDESWHFAYAQSLAQRGALPTGTNPALPNYSTDQALADTADHASIVALYPLQTRPSWSPGAQRTYDRTYNRTHPDRSNGGRYNTEASNPPLLYGYDDVAYLVDDGGNAFSRLYSMQIWNVTLLLATVLGAWLLAGEVFGRRRVVQLACAGVVGLIPEMTYILTSVNPDAMLTALWSLATWMGVRVIRRHAQPRDVGALCALTAAAILAKATGYAFVPAALVAIVIGWRRRSPQERRTGRLRLAASVGWLLAPVVAWAAYCKVDGRPIVNSIATTTAATGAHFQILQFLSYLWQFYLPRLGFMTSFKTTPDGLAVYELWVRQVWAVFGYLDVGFPNWCDTVLGAFTALVGIAGAILLIRRLLQRRGGALGLVVFLLVSLGALLLLLHVSDYRTEISGNGSLLQGRYLLPAVSTFALGVGLMVSRLPARLRIPTTGVIFAGMLCVQLLALASVTTAYYT